MAPTYEHTQVGRLALILMMVGALAAFWIAGNVPDLEKQGRIVLASVGVFLALILLIFGWLTVTVDREHVRIRFGLGLIRKRFPTSRLVEARPVRNAWWYGWGIRLTPHGWLFNVSGLDAVELLMGDGRKYRIGTDEPEELAAAINRARKTR